MNRQTSHQRYENERIRSDTQTSAEHGAVRWSPIKSLWVSGMYTGTAAAFLFYASWSGVLVFVVSSAITLCAGHSVGMHRRLIHKSFQCPLWLERLIVWLGTLVGLGGPLTMAHTHDLRDWAQRQRRCHDYFGHAQPMHIDAFWQLHCEIVLEHPPLFAPEPSLAGSRFYRFIDRTHMFQQLPLAALLFFGGGIGWVLWGICARVAVSMTGHWLIGYFAHNQGVQTWYVDQAAVQGFDVEYCGLITFGECGHNNHHAFPRSAKIGLRDDQLDPGWWLIQAFRHLGLAWNIQTPELLPVRPELRRVDESPGVAETVK